MTLRVSHLTGFNSGFRQALAFVDSAASANSASVTAPASINPGDLLVLVQFGLSFTTLPTAVTPTGFTNLYNNTAVLGLNAFRTMIDYKIADGSEDGATITGMDAATDRKILLQFRGNLPITSVSAVQDLAFEATDGDPADQTCNASGGLPPLIIIAMYRGSTTIDPRGFSPAADGEIFPPAIDTFSVKYKVYNGSPQDTSVSMDDEGTGNHLLSFYLNVT